jgi:hypothetical protein
VALYFPFVVKFFVLSVLFYASEQELHFFSRNRNAEGHLRIAACKSKGPPVSGKAFVLFRLEQKRRLPFLYRIGFFILRFMQQVMFMGAKMQKKRTGTASPLIISSCGHPDF